MAQMSTESTAELAGELHKQGKEQTAAAPSGYAPPAA